MGGTLFASFPKFPPTQPAAATSPTLHMRRPLVCQLSYLGLEVALEPLGKYGRSPYFTLRALESAGVVGPGSCPDCLLSIPLPLSFRPALRRLCE